MNIGGIRRLARYLGVLMLVGGYAALLFLLLVLKQFLFEPESVFAINAFTEFLASGAPPLTITVDGRDAVIQIDSAARALLVIVAGGLAIVACASVLKMLIGGGLRLLRFANGADAGVDS